jgi:hypothetical protein
MQGPITHIARDGQMENEPAAASEEECSIGEVWRAEDDIGRPGAGL